MGGSPDIECMSPALGLADAFQAPQLGPPDAQPPNEFAEALSLWSREGSSHAAYGASQLQYAKQQADTARFLAEEAMRRLEKGRSLFECVQARSIHWTFPVLYCTAASRRSTRRTKTARFF